MAGKVLLPFRKYGVELRDITFNPNPGNLSEQSIVITLRTISAVVKIGLDSLIVFTNNPSWDSMEQFLVTIDAVLRDFRSVIGRPPLRQEGELALHIMADGGLHNAGGTARLIHQELLGEAQFYAVGVYREDSALVIDKSTAHENAVFLKIQRSFEGSVAFSEAFPKLLSDELAALRLIGFDSIL
ncbi:MAG: hypothetical protein JNL62_05640 [Bryobacterales bacterium]|nr:hypothetical protein [Bryobacterales bacterium]